MAEEISVNEESNEEIQIQPNQEPSKEATVGEGGDEGAASPPATVNVLGREYDLSKLDQVQELAKDYERLGRMYAPLLQQVRELNERLQSFQGEPPQPLERAEGDVDEITKRYLKERLNVVTLEDLRQNVVTLLEELRQMEEDRRLEEYLRALEAIYDGSDGRPKFDRMKVIEFCAQNGTSNPEHGYKLMHWNELVDWEVRQRKAAPQAPPSSGGGAERIIRPKKRVFGPPANPEEEVSLREAMLETLEELAPKEGI